MKPLALALALFVTAAAAHAKEVLPFIEDDYTKAIARAKTKNVPVFVETWAPWCHTCRSMKAYVYTDAKLERYAGRFVWLSINTEDAKNAAFLQRYPIPALPTLLVLDAKHDTVALRYTGGATLPQLEKLLGDAEKTYRAKNQSEADNLLAKGDRLASDGNQADAAKAYEQAIVAAPKSWKGLGRTSEALLFALTMSDQNEQCAQRAIELYPRVKGTSSAPNVSSTGLSCAVALDKTNAKRMAWLTTLEAATRETFADAGISMSGDDKSGLYMALIDARDAVGDEEDVLKLKNEWVAFLEDAAAKAKTAEQRAVYDSHRLSAYLDLGTPEKAIPMLEQSERDFPNDYNPPARLAASYRAMKEYDKALAASTRAMAKVYGPRKLNVMSLRTDIYVALGDTKAAKETLQAAIDYAKSLPEAQRSASRIAAFEKRVASMQ